VRVKTVHTGDVALISIRRHKNGALVEEEPEFAVALTLKVTVVVAEFVIGQHATLVAGFKPKFHQGADSGIAGNPESHHGGFPIPVSVISMVGQPRFPASWRDVRNVTEPW